MKLSFEIDDGVFLRLIEISKGISVPVYPLCAKCGKPSQMTHLEKEGLVCNECWNTICQMRKPIEGKKNE